MQKVLRNHLLRIALLVAVSYGVIVYSYARHFDHKISGLICMGDRFYEPDEIPSGIFYLHNSIGYDGQFFYTIALDPFDTQGFGRHVDVPAYRYQRIAYPLLAGLLSFGDCDNVPASLVTVNVLALVLGTLLMAMVFQSKGMSPWYSLFYPCISGLLIATLRDLSAPLAMTCMVAAFFFYDRQRPLWLTLSLGLGLLARETTLAIVPFLFVDTVFVRKRYRLLLPIGLAVATFAGWQAYMFFHFGRPSWGGGSRNFGPPFQAMIAHIKSVIPSTQPPIWEKVYLLLFVATAVVCLAMAVRELFRSRSPVSFCFLGFSVQPFLMSKYVWVEPWSYGRVLVAAPILAMLAFAQSRSRWYLIPLGMHAVLYIVAVLWLNVF